MDEINSSLLWLSSAYRTSGSNAEPTWELTQHITCADPMHQLRCEVLSATLPFSFVQLQAPNNELPWTLTSGGTTTGTLLIAEGNWDILELLDRLSTLLTDVLAAAGVTPPTWDFTYDAVSSTTTLGMSTVPAGTASLSLLWGQCDLLAPFFGHTYAASTVLSWAAGVNTSTNTVSPYAVDVSPASSLFLRSDLAQQPTNQEVLVEALPTVSDILCEVQVTTEPNSVLHYVGDGLVTRLSTKQITSLSLLWTTTSYNSVSFRGLPWRVSLRVSEWRPTWMDKQQEEELARAAAEQVRLQHARQALIGEARQGVANLKKRLRPEPEEGEEMDT